MRRTTSNPIPLFVRVRILFTFLFNYFPLYFFFISEKAIENGFYIRIFSDRLGEKKWCSRSVYYFLRGRMMIPDNLFPRCLHFHFICWNDSNFKLKSSCYNLDCSDTLEFSESCRKLSVMMFTVIYSFADSAGKGNFRTATLKSRHIP